MRDRSCQIGYQTRSNRNLEHIDLEVTRECNLDCIHCSAEDHRAAHELSVDEAKHILHEGQWLGLKTIGFTGGEPFLRKRKLQELIRFCRDEIGIAIHLHTNGTKISRKSAEELRRMGCDVTIPLHGSSSKTHDPITRTNGSMKLTMKGLVKLLETGANATVYVVPMKANLHEIIPLIRMASEKGCKKYRILSLSPTGRAYDIFTSIAPDAREVMWLNEQLSKIQEEIDVELYGGFCTRSMYQSLRILPGHNSCLAAENRLHIDAFGNVFPCTASAGRAIFSAGNLRASGSTLSEIWKYSPLLQFIRDFHSNPPRKCCGCKLHPECMSGCRVMMSYKYGDVTIADPRCKGPC